MSVLERLVSITYSRKIPLVVNFEITKRCVNDCVFCYIDERRDKELNFFEIKKILCQLKDMGTIFLVFTGGEPFLRDDFVRVVEFAKRMNFHIKVFSSFAFKNRRKIVEAYNNGLFDVEVSLHGKKDTHNRVVRNNTFDETIENILFANNVGYRVTIKTPITKINMGDLLWIKEFAQKNNLIVKFDPIITPSNNGVRKNYEFQIDSKEFSFLLERGIFDLNLTNSSNHNEYFSCGALRNLCAISCEGYLYPCLAFPYVVGDLKKNSFVEVWNSYLSENLRIEISKPPNRCTKCDMMNICSWCVGISYLENKSFDYVYEVACNLAKELKKRG